MQIQKYKKRLKRIAAAIRNNPKIDKDLKRRAVHDIRMFVNNDEILLRIAPQNDSGWNAIELSDAFGWGAASQVTGAKVGSHEWSRLDDQIGVVNSDDRLKAGDYTVSIDAAGVHVGCQDITWTQYKALKKAVRKSGYVS